jgi:ribose/xylose/arabinose/galactoside ABC-type transport system permease subunit
VLILPLLATFAADGSHYLVGWWIGRSRLGFALRIVGNDEMVAVHCGINTARTKVVLFVFQHLCIDSRRADSAARLRRTKT